MLRNGLIFLILDVTKGLVSALTKNCINLIANCPLGALVIFDSGRNIFLLCICARADSPSPDSGRFDTDFINLSKTFIFITTTFHGNRAKNNPLKNKTSSSLEWTLTLFS